MCGAIIRAGRRGGRGEEWDKVGGEGEKVRGGEGVGAEVRRRSREEDEENGENEERVRTWGGEMGDRG